MRIIPKQLAQLAPEISSWSIEKLRVELSALGFETEVLEGATSILELDLAPNRPDALSVLGIARELRALNALRKNKQVPTLRLEAMGFFEALPHLKTFQLKMPKNNLVPQYRAVLFENITIQPSPRWLQTELALMGHRPVNNIVDLTNYLMLIYGQPLHAFDADAILGDTFTIRLAKTGEKLETLDHVERILTPEMLVAVDAKEPIDLVGIMGGLNTEVTTRTTHVLLQSAVFDSRIISKTSQILDLKTDGSLRYERGIDSSIAVPVLDQAIHFLRSREFGKAKAVSSLNHEMSTRKIRPIVYLPEKIDHLLGFRTTFKKQASILELLGCQVIQAENFKVVPPAWRTDLIIWQDLAEEIARMQNYDAVIPNKKLSKTLISKHESLLEWSEGVKDRIVDLGFSEVLTYSFISRQDLDILGLPDTGELANPLNPTLRFLRPSLLPGLARAVSQNAVFDPILIFEIGHVFPNKSTEQINFALAIAGTKEPTSAWTSRLADALGLDSKEFNASLHLVELKDNERVMYKIRKPRVTLIEISLETLKLKARAIPSRYYNPINIVSYRPISKYPPVTRDIALILLRTTDSDQVAKFIATLNPFVEYVELFDEFISDRFGIDMKSIAFHVYYSTHERTLFDEEINLVHSSIEDSLRSTFKAQIR
ncbi:phenylalanine--tRNA ligase subunit beta [Candidatus Berkelbacteria bacterium]|nr:phenylalanine--tRNA ligase subunit beta [Candidatus Berkelbacteria bacterium]